MSFYNEMRSYFQYVKRIKNCNTTIQQQLYACEHSSESQTYFTTLSAPFKTVLLCRHCFTTSSAPSNAAAEKGSKSERESEGEFY
jgi:hypothetical protein